MRYASPLSLFGRLCVLSVTALFGSLVSSSAHAENNQVLIVPFSQQNPLLPHPAHEGAPITLKGIIRNATCGSYRVIWDINQNNEFDDEAFTVSRNNTTNTVYDIGRTFVVPYVDHARPLNINVRAECGGAGGAASYGTFKMFVYNFGQNGQGDERLSTDPRNWTEEQVEIMTSMAIQESMWHSHRTMRDISGTNHALEARADYVHATALAQWLFVINNHQPAYPPSAVGPGDGSAEWRAVNEQRWNTDPYAESAMRLLNYNVARSYARGVDGRDESDVCGYRNGNNTFNCNRINGTADGAGIYVGRSGYGSRENVYITGMSTGAIATVLPALSGTKVRVGIAAGQSWEWYVQQLVDYLGYQQIDEGGCPNGGWYYYEINSGSCRYSDLSTTQWAYIGLESAEVAGAPYGVFVNNTHKYRIANNLISNQQGDGGAAYDNRRWSRSDVKLTGGQLLGARWLGVHNMSQNSNSAPYPNESSHSRRTLRDSYERYLSYVVNRFTSRKVSGTLGWQDGLWQHGDYLCGDTNGIYNQPNCGNTYSLYSHQKAYHTGSPAMHFVGPYDWYRMFSIYYVRAQRRDANANSGRANYGNFGQLSDGYCEAHSVTCAYGNGFMSSLMGGLVMTPAVFNPKPIPIGSLAPIQPGQQPVAAVTVTEGCVPGQGRITVSHQESFHPNSDASITLYMWDMDASNGLWWENGGQPDLDVNGNPMRTADRFNNLTYAYARAGTYQVTLLVEDNTQQHKDIRVGTVTVNAAADVPPAVATGGPYSIEVGAPLALNASASDGNEACGDVLRVDWDLDGNGTFEVSGATTNVPWGSLSNLPRNQPFNITARVRDTFGAVDTVTETTTLSIYDKAPVAVATVNPNQAACRQDVTFDGSGSYHRNPRRTISTYQWTVDGRTSDRSIFTTNFSSYGKRRATLTIQDDLGNESQAEVEVDVNLGNLPPVVRVVNDQITIMSIDDLRVNASQSSDPNSDCGDSVVQIGWYLHRPGVAPNLDAAPQFVGGAPVIPTADWQNAMGWPANDQLIVTVKVTDTFGAFSTKDIAVTGVRAEPVPVIAQVPNPSAYRVDNGSSSTRIDGRESYSLLDGVTITRYEWDIDCDGTYEREAGQFLYEKVFPPNTPANQLPPVRICLRVTDSNGNVQLSEPYTVQYQPLGDTSPFADADPSDAPERGYHILIGQPLTLDGSSSFDPDAQDFNDEIVEYKWTVNNVSNPTLTRTSDQPDPALLPLSVAQLASFGVNDLGDYDIALRVTDLAGNVGQDSAKLTVHNDVANLVVVINPANAAPNARVTFDASRSEHTHPDIDITSVIWLFGDLQASGGACATDADCGAGYCITNPSTSALQCMTGSLGDQEGVVVNQSFTQITPAPGDAVPVTLVVRDSNGGQAQDSDLNIRVDQGNRLPQANAGGGTAIGGNDVLGPYTTVFAPAALGSQLVTFDGSRSAEPDAQYGDRIESYTWQIGDCTCSTVPARHGVCPVASANVGASLPTLSLAQLGQCGLNGVGNYNVALTVTDRFGAEGRSQTSINLIEGLSARAQAQPNRTSCQQQVTFDGRSSVISGPADQGYNIVSYEWDIDGDGVADFNNATFSTPVVAMPQNGQVQLTARLTVTNALGAALIAANQDPGPHRSTSDVTVTINVQELAPVANPGGPYRTGGNPQDGFAPVTVDGRASSDPNAPCDMITEYWWDTDGDGQYGRDDTNGPTTVNGQRSDYVGETITFTSSNWRTNTTANVGLKVRDAFGQWSTPTLADIIISDVVPPSGEVLSPRVGACAAETAPNTSSARVRVRHPVSNPQPVRVDIKLGANVVGSSTVQANQFNANKEATIDVPINLNNVAEGEYSVVALFTLVNNPNAVTQATSGGAVTFDFTPPVINIGPQPTEGVCYANGRAPEAEVEVIDNFDNAPQVSQSLVEDSCLRTLRITARDRCGQESTAERSYRTAQPMSAVVNGVTEGQLQAQTNATWEINGLAACSNGVEASLSRDGLAYAPYAEGAQISTPGEYRLRLSVLNCLGVPRDQVVSFRINRAPVAVALPDGHPNADPELAGGYIIAEGSALTLDGTLSRAPEQEDSLTRYTWTIAGQPPLNGPRPVVNTNANGRFDGVLEVEDGFGSTHTETFKLTVTDINPIANAGGPYVANQDVPITFSASASRSLNPAADAISRVVWSWGDGSADTEAAKDQPVTHSYSTQGAYTVTLTVFDEDSSSEVEVGVVIADVDPQIEALYTHEVMGEENLERPDPVVAYESLPLTFGMVAQPGAENDPITLYQWDFDGDNIFDVNTQEPFAEWQYMEPGLYEVGLLVRDRDSFTFRTQLVDVKPIDFQRVFDFVGHSLAERFASGNLSPLNRLRLAATSGSVAAGRWGQVHDGFDADPERELEVGPMPERAERLHLQRQGVSFAAAQRVLSDLVQAQTTGEDFGTEVWVLSRQLHREIAYDLAAVQADPEGVYSGRAGDPYFVRRKSVAADFKQLVATLYNDENFEKDARRVPNTQGLSLTLQNNARRSLDWLNVGVDQCADPRFEAFEVNRGVDNAPAYFVEAERVRELAYDALSGMLAEMEAYIDAGADDQGPARQDIIEAADSLRVILDRAALNMDVLNCEENCSSNRNALEIELEAMDLIDALRDANSKGAYVMHWQSCLVDYLRFRIKASLVAVRSQCGLLSPYYIKSNEVFSQGESLLTQEDDIIGALNFYTDSAQRCLILDVYNKCLVRVDVNAEPYDYPAVCLE